MPNRPCQGELVFRVLDVVTTVDDVPLSVFQDLADDNDLIGHIAGDAIGVQEINAVEESKSGVFRSRRSSSSAGRSSRAPLYPSSTYSFTRTSPAALIWAFRTAIWLSIVRSFFCNSELTRDAGVQDHLLNIPPLIPKRRKRVESRDPIGNNPHEEPRSAARLYRPIYSMILSGRCFTCVHGRAVSGAIAREVLE